MHERAKHFSTHRLFLWLKVQLIKCSVCSCSQCTAELLHLLTRSVPPRMCTRIQHIRALICREDLLKKEEGEFSLKYAIMVSLVSLNLMNSILIPKGREVINMVTVILHLCFYTSIRLACWFPTCELIRRLIGGWPTQQGKIVDCHTVWSCN